MKTLAEHILDISQNSTRAGAEEVEILWEEPREQDLLRITVRDNGPGIPGKILSQVMDPYTTTRSTRKVGMGLPLLRQNAEQTGGRVLIASEAGEGTRVTAEFVPSHIDLPGKGDLAGTLVLLLTGNPGVDFTFRFAKGKRAFSVTSREVRSVLDTGNLSGEVLNGLTGFFHENIREVLHNQ